MIEKIFIIFAVFWIISLISIGFLIMKQNKYTGFSDKYYKYEKYISLVFKMLFLSGGLCAVFVLTLCIGLIINI